MPARESNAALLASLALSAGISSAGHATLTADMLGSGTRGGKTVQVTKNTVVDFHYVLVDENQAELESTRDGHPSSILHGHHNVIRGVEQSLAGHIAGDRFSITLEPTEAYGPRRDDAKQRVSKKYFADPKRLRPGLITQLRTEQGVRSVLVVKVGVKMVDVDLNHPLAGRTLTFDIEVVDVRAATPDEISHGHAHGPHSAHH
jgi:FKBP-type peptidyl-prolyl cis-trans isomerase SlyD